MSLAFALSFAVLLALVVDDVRLRMRLHRQADKAIDQTIELEATRAELAIADAEVRRLNGVVAVQRRTQQGRAS